MRLSRCLSVPAPFRLLSRVSSPWVCRLHSGISWLFLGSVLTVPLGHGPSVWVCVCLAESALLGLLVFRMCLWARWCLSVRLLVSVSLVGVASVSLRALVILMDVLVCSCARGSRSRPVDFFCCFRDCLPFSWASVVSGCVGGRWCVCCFSLRLSTSPRVVGVSVFHWAWACRRLFASGSVCFRRFSRDSPQVRVPLCLLDTLPKAFWVCLCVCASG